MGFIYGATARLYSPLTVAERQAAITAQYADAYHSPLALQPLSYHELDWTVEEFSRGCYTGVCGPGVMSRMGEGWRGRVGGVGWAGTELAVEWAGYMSGAVESGERAAHEVLEGLGRKVGEWVQEEKRGEGWAVGELAQAGAWEVAVKQALPSALAAQQLLLGAGAAALAGLAWWWRRR